MTVGYKRTAFNDLTGEVLKRQESEIINFCEKRNLGVPVFFEDNGGERKLRGTNRMVGLNELYREFKWTGNRSGCRRL